MPKYVKRPVEIEAIQWTGDNRREIFDFCDQSYFNTKFETGELVLMIQTLEGTMEASTGDYIIKGIKGEFYIADKKKFIEEYQEYEKTL